MHERPGTIERAPGVIQASINPFDTARAVSNAGRGGNAIADTSREREVAEVKGMMLIAKQFPRDERGAMDRILNACQRRGLAERATYSYARGGTEITGPSIRLAEVIAQHWGNIVSGIRELEQRSGESTVEAFAWDIETNRRESRVFQVSHWRYKKDGTGYRLTDPRDIYEMVANQGARRLRACILAIIPGDVTEAAVAQCERTLAANIEVTPERVQAMLAKFASIGVDKAQIEARIQRRIEAIQPAQMLALGKIYNSVEAGMSAAQEWFALLPSPDEATNDDAATKRVVSSRDKLKRAIGPQQDGGAIAAAKAAGANAARNGADRTDCPTTLSEGERGAWLEGFDGAHETEDAR